MFLDKKIATRQSYGEALAELGEENKNVVVLDADLSGATVLLEKFRMLVLLRCLQQEELMIK